MSSTSIASRPGWPEIVAGLVVFAVLLLGFALAYNLLPSDPVLQGVVGSTAGGVAGAGGWATAFALRIRSLPPFGFRRVSPRWLSVILPIAIMVGALSALLFRRTGSIWPGVVLHCVYNASNSVGSVLGIGPG